MNTDIILKMKPSGLIEIHFEGDVTFLESSTCIPFTLLFKDVDIVAFSEEFKK